MGYKAALVFSSFVSSFFMGMTLSMSVKYFHCINQGFGVSRKAVRYSAS